MSESYKYDTAGWHLIHTDENKALVSGDSNVTLDASNVTTVWKLTADIADMVDASNSFARIPDNYPLTRYNWEEGDASSLEANTVYWVKTNAIEATTSSDMFTFTITSNESANQGTTSLKFGFDDSETTTNIDLAPAAPGWDSRISSILTYADYTTSLIPTNWSGVLNANLSLTFADVPVTSNLVKNTNAISDTYFGYFLYFNITHESTITWDSEACASLFQYCMLKTAASQPVDIIDMRTNSSYDFVATGTPVATLNKNYLIVFAYSP